MGTVQMRYDGMVVRHTLQGEQGEKGKEVNGCGRDGGMKARRKRRGGGRGGNRGNTWIESERKREGEEVARVGVGGSGAKERWIFLVLMVVHNFGVADTASGNIQKKGGKMEEIRRKKELARISWAEQEDKRQCQEQGRGKSRMRWKTVRCNLLNGSAWCIEKKQMTKYTRTFDIFFEIEHRMRREEIEEQIKSTKIPSKDGGLQLTRQGSSG